MSNADNSLPLCEHNWVFVDLYYASSFKIGEPKLINACWFCSGCGLRINKAKVVTFE